MQRICVFSLISLLPILTSGATSALADPFGVSTPIGLRYQQGGTDAVQRPASSMPVAAQGDYGGGFVEFLLRGARQSAPQPNAATYRPYPADIGPGMVESPDQPGRVVMDPRFLRQEVSYHGPEEKGTVIIDTRERMLYLVQGTGRALRYGIGVGRPGFTWSGVHHVTQKREWPDWTPPEEMLRRRPDLPRHMAGGSENPLGARALYLGSTLYRIHELQRAVDDRDAGLRGLHPHAQRGRHRPLRAGQSGR